MGRGLIIILLFCFLTSWSQEQNSNAREKDSLLENLQKENERLAQKARNAKIEDSLQQEALLDQIAKLKNNDAQNRNRLKKQLDSLIKAQDAQKVKAKQEVDSLRSTNPGIPVVVFSDTIFYIYSGLGPFSPVNRAQLIARKVKELVDEEQFDTLLLNVRESLQGYDVMHGTTVLLSVTEQDAFWVNKSAQQTAEQYKNALKSCVISYQYESGIIALIIRISLLCLVILLFVFGIKYMNRGFTWVNRYLLESGKPFLKGIKLGNYEFLSLEQEERFVRLILRVIKWIFIITIVYLSLPLVFSIFPATKGIATTLFGYVLHPLINFGSAIINYIPELITILVIVGLTRYFVRFLRFLASEVESGKLQLTGFYPDWATPTFNLLKIIIYAFAFIVIFPYLPGSNSPIFQGVSVFLGLLISLGSSSAIGNIIAGLVITYMRAFKLGDRVKIGDTVGDVTEKTMLVTRLRTIKNEDVTIPNSSILSGSTINYSSSARQLGLILHSSVTIGYDVPWRTVHELLIQAASKTQHIKKEPVPFVLQTSLDDFYVCYQVNAYTERADITAKIYSELHAHIQDAFNEAGVEILSPHYRAARDGNTMAIPPDYLPPDYTPPSFNIHSDKE
jgi:small-conductance mechanosensitive channel